MSDISAAITSTLSILQAATVVAKGLYQGKVEADVKVRMGELLDLIFDARQKAFESQDELAAVKTLAADLEDKLMRLKEWGDDKKRYRLFKPESLGAVVYGLRESASGGDPPHYLCTSCCQQSVKSILNTKQSVAKQTVFLCPLCSAQFETAYRGSVTPEYAPE